MRYASAFGKHGSKLLLGTTYFGSSNTKEESFALMDEFVACGGTHLDTARSYSLGASEEIIGEWMRSRRHPEVFVSTKGGYPLAGTSTPRIHPAELREDLEASLRALGQENVNFYWIHWDDESVPVEEIVDAMNLFCREGKILRFGASNWTNERFAAANAYAKQSGQKGFEALQVRYSPAVVNPESKTDPVVRDVTEREVAFCREQKIPLVCYSAQAKGFFSKMAQGGVEMLSSKAKARFWCEENERRLKKIVSLAESHSCSVASLVCALMISRSDPEMFAIIGPSRVEQVRDSMLGADLVLSREEIAGVLGELA